MEIKHGLSAALMLCSLATAHGLVNPIVWSHGRPRVLASQSSQSRFHTEPSSARTCTSSGRSNTSTVRLELVSSVGFLPSFSVLPLNGLTAIVALLASTVAGVKIDKRIPNSGILGTLLAAATLSNIFPAIPTSHPIYDQCWSWILPASLVLLLLGNDSSRNTPAATVAENPRQDVSPWQAIPRVGAPFVISILGSLVGCAVSYKLAVNKAWLPPVEAKAAVACLASSYVGGSVNLFATAKLLRAPAELLSSLAAADLLVMSLYFSFLSVSLRWPRLQNLFAVETTFVGSTEGSSNTAIEDPKTTKSTASSVRQSLQDFSCITSIVGGIVGFANFVEGLIGDWFPGAACAVIAGVTPLLQSVANRRLSGRAWWIRTTQMAKRLSDPCFLLFFASIGLGMDVRKTLEMGPACFVVSLLALSIHLLVTVLGSAKILPAKRWKIGLPDVWIASNAAIGGPATAAAFCNRLPGPAHLLRGRVLAATLWGVVGYGIGTFLGMKLYSFLG